jgi:hypothetical protein
MNYEQEIELIQAVVELQKYIHQHHEDSGSECGVIISHPIQPPPEQDKCCSRNAIRKDRK